MKKTIYEGSKKIIHYLTKTLKGDPFKKFYSALSEMTKYHYIDTSTASLIEGSLHLRELRVEDVMVPKAQMTYLRIDDPLDKILDIVNEYSHSRYPIFDSQGQFVQGLLLAKDLISHKVIDKHEFSIQDLLRPTFHAPLSRRLHELLNDFRRHHSHMAVVVDEYGMCVGIITIEDVLEQIVGEIEDEHDSLDEPMIFDHGNKRVYSVKAITPIDDFNKFFKTNFNSEEFDTLGGVVTSFFGYLPKKGESVIMNGLKFIIIRADMRKIHLIKIQDDRALES